MGVFNQLKNLLFLLITLALWARFIFAIADPEMADPPSVFDGFAIYQTWHGFLSTLYHVTNVLMAPLTWIFSLLRGIIPSNLAPWVPAANSEMVIEWLQSQKALKPAIDAFLKQPNADKIFLGQFQWLVFPAIILYQCLSGVADKVFEFLKNLLWNVLIEFSFTKKKQAAYQETLEKRAADLMKLKVEYRNLSKEASMLAESVITDELTQLYNKRFFIQRVQEEVKHAKDKKELFAIVMVDIDHFKKLNDNYGHLMGDKVLKEVAAQVKKFTPKGCYACRFGGEEFSVIMPRKNPLDALSISEAIHKAIPQLRFEEDPNLVVTISMGLLSANFENPQAQELKTFEDAIKLADDELYRAKLNGRNRIEHVKL